jgi:general secretion pathway protein G
MKRIEKHHHKRAGFTLIEMLVVLAILVLLMSMVGPRILGSRKKADISTTKSQIGMLMASLETYDLDMRTYPETDQGLQALIELPSEEDSDSTSKWDGPYITKQAIPKDPWGNDYQYEFPPTKGKDKEAPNIWSFGPDGEDNTEDDIISWISEDEEVTESTASLGN